MKNLVLCFALLSMTAYTSGSKNKQNTERSTELASKPQLELVWASDTLLRTSESVLFDRDRNLLYVSNINMDPWIKDGNGFISKMDMSGNIVDLKWVEDMNAPKAMGMYNNQLYVVDIDEVIAINIEKGSIIQKIKIEGNPDINDVAIGEDGTIYTSGFTSNFVYAVKDGKVEKVYQGEPEEKINGLYWENDRILMCTSGSQQFKAFIWETKEVTILGENLGRGDGIASIGNGSYFTSSWQGLVVYFPVEGVSTVVLETTDKNENSDDIDYNIRVGILYVPTFFGNQVKAYHFINS